MCLQALDVLKRFPEFVDEGRTLLVDKMLPKKNERGTPEYDGERHHHAEVLYGRGNIANEHRPGGDHDSRKNSQHSQRGRPLRIALKIRPRGLGLWRHLAGYDSRRSPPYKGSYKGQRVQTARVFLPARNRPMRDEEATCIQGCRTKEIAVDHAPSSARAKKQNPKADDDNKILDNITF